MTFAVGSAEGMTRENTSIAFTPDANPIIIPSNNIRGIIPVYPDKRSPIWSSSGASSIDFSSDHGSWQTLLIIDLPLDLPTGSGVFSINTEVTYAQYSGSVNTQNINMEILPGIGSPNPFRYIDPMNGAITDTNFNGLEPRSFYQFRPELVANLFSPEWPAYGAVEIKSTVN